MGFLITTILILSSVTSQLGVFAAERGDVYKLRVWYAVTIVLGLIFVLIVGYEWYEMIHHGVTIQASVFGSVFYILTGFHAIHVSAGIVAFLVIMLRTAKSSSRQHRQPPLWQFLTTGTSWT